MHPNFGPQNAMSFRLQTFRVPFILNPKGVQGLSFGFAGFCAEELGPPSLTKAYASGFR